MTGADSTTTTTTTKPQVKHILSKELQLYFEKVCASVLDETQPEYRTAGLASLRDDPGLHQLVPYFVQFVAEKVTHNLKDLFVLTQMMLLIDALTRNDKLNLTPYVSWPAPTALAVLEISALPLLTWDLDPRVCEPSTPSNIYLHGWLILTFHVQVASLVPPVLTCLIGRSLGSGIGSLDHYDLRDLAASLLGHLCHKYSKYSHNLKPRLARSLLKTYLDPKKPYGSHYGAILGLKGIGGAEVVRQLIIPSLKTFGELLEEDLSSDSTSSAKKQEAEKVVAAILNALGALVDDEVPIMMMNGHSEESANEIRTKLIDRIGPVIGDRVADSGHTKLAKAILEGDLVGV